MKKFSAILILVLVTLFSVCADEVTYVYKNSVSSLGLEKSRIGDVFRDQDNNLVIVSHKRGDVTEFDIVRTKTEIKVGNQLTRKKLPLVFIGAYAGMENTGISASMATFGYPVYLMAAFETDYKMSKQNAYCGFKADIPLSNLSENKFTLIEDGAGYAYSLVGFDLEKISENENLLTKWGLGYRHIVGSFFWSAEYNVSIGLKDVKKVSGFSATAGVMI